MPKQFVFVAGHSGAGKNTFITKATGEDGAGLRERYRLHGTIERLGAEFGNCNRSIGSKAETLLIKWQFDNHYWIELLKKRMPLAQHRVILLWKPDDLHRADLIGRQERLIQEGKLEAAKKWAPDPGHLEREWYELLVPLFGDIHLRGIRCELVHGRTHEPLSDWP